ncbi:MAG: hypothetical protein ACJ8LI_12385, partial [Chthoniobacterales bacterium]
RIPAVNARIESRNELDSMVVNVELTVNSIIQGVALSFLVDSARNVLASGRTGTWLYVYAGLVIILVFWVRSLIHTWTLMRWPLELGHNCLYFLCALVEVLAFTHLNEPFMWFALLAVFALTVWAVFIYDLRVIRLRMEDSAGVNGSELYAAVLRDQWLNIVVVVPLLILLNAGAAFAIHARPDFFIARDAHLILIAAEALGLSGYLWFVIRGFTKLTPLIAATREDWRTQPAELPDE